MGPLFLANWRLINQRFCVLIWVVATALAIVIVVHFAQGSQACAGSAAACGAHRFPH